MKEKRKLRDKMSLKMVIPGDHIDVGNDEEMFSLRALRSCKVNLCPENYFTAFNDLLP